MFASEVVLEHRKLLYILQQIWKFRNSPRPQQMLEAHSSRPDALNVPEEQDGVKSL
jgi:hypothetical protein